MSCLELNKDETQNGNKEGSSSVKRSERIKIKREKEELEDQVSDTSSISEFSLSSDVGKKRTSSSANRYTFKSKRLQELQEKMESETIHDTVVDFLKEANKNVGQMDSGSGRSSRSSSRRQSLEEDRVHVSFGNEGKNHRMSTAVKKRKVSSKKTPVSRLEAMKNDNEIPSSSEDEESNKPLSQLKKDIKKTEREEPERVVKKVIKVVKKFKTKSGETKTKVVKIIKKMGVRKKSKEACTVVTGRRRIRCGECKGCSIQDDCGECRWCK